MEGRLAVDVWWGVPAGHALVLASCVGGWLACKLGGR